MKPLTVSDLVARKGKVLQLEVLTGDVGLDRPIRVPQVSSPGLVLAGYLKRFPAKRVQVLGETEVEYLRSLSVEDRRKAWEGLINFDLPCIFVTKGQRIPKELAAMAKKRGIPLLKSKLSTAEFYQRLTPYLNEIFAPRTKLHGSLADVFGVGLLFMGRSGIGKSECVLDLVEHPRAQAVQAGGPAQPCCQRGTPSVFLSGRNGMNRRRWGRAKKGRASSDGGTRPEVEVRPVTGCV